MLSNFGVEPAKIDDCLSACSLAEEHLSSCLGMPGKRVTALLFFRDKLTVYIREMTGGSSLFRCREICLLYTLHEGTSNRTDNPFRRPTENPLEEFQYHSEAWECHHDSGYGSLTYFAVGFRVGVTGSRNLGTSSADV